ncbi:MMPL family transporter [Catenovulum sp. SM1970]|uniref:efflux RND transporter permease subunit n=1 Tax=Marinifaba aquimaris TaxID=2741323 RepID=UPI001572F91B|nr:MMPL family transporter [Marinifaba aquimaris]NTS76836.1 MMPL family transporter [Marinifaba aquimaris]
MKLSFINAVLSRPIITILCCILIVAGLGYGTSYLTFRGDYKVFFGDNNPQLQGFEEMQKTFNKNDNVSIVIAPKNENVFTNETFELIFKITEDSWQTPYSTRVDSITNYQHTSAEEDDLLVEDILLDPADLSPAKLEYAKSVVLNEPMLVNRLIAPQGHVAMINITVQLPEKDKNQEVLDVVKHVRDMVDKYKAEYPDTDFHLAGIVMMNNGFIEEAQSDAQTLIPGMFLAIFIMLLLMLRSFTGMFATIIVIITSIVATLGGAGLAGFYISTPTVNVPVMVMTLAVADCVHIIASMHYYLRKGLSKNAAITEAVNTNITPVFITSATTAIGFLTFNFSDVPPLRDLGNMVAWGVMLAFVLAITLLPALLKLLPARAIKQTDNSNFMERFAEVVIEKRTPILIGSTLLIVAVIALVPQNKVNDVPIEYFDESITFRQDSDFMDQHLMGVSTIDIEISSGEENGINKPKFIKQLDDFSLWLREQDRIDHVFTLSDTFKRLNKSMHGDDQAYYRLPEDNELAAQYLLMYEMSLPYGLDLNNQLNIDKSAVRLTLAMDNVGSDEILAMEQKVLGWFKDNAPELTVRGASPALMFGHIGDRNMSSMLIGTTVATILISGLLIVALRSLKLGTISLLPNLLPAGLGFGFWALYSGNINLGLSVVTSMSLGIVVDDTVHFLAKYKLAREAGKTAEDAVRYAFSRVGRALWITTLVLATGFMVLAQSAFALNGNMGLLTAVIIVLALIVDFLFLPAFLILTDKKQYPVKESAHAAIQVQN